MVSQFIVLAQNTLMSLNATVSFSDLENNQIQSLEDDSLKGVTVNGQM